MPKRKCKFNRKLQTKFSCCEGGQNKNEAECIIYKPFMSVANKGSYDLDAHINTAKHKKQIMSCHNTLKVSDFFVKKTSG
jgi:hypothetical protein